MIRGLIFILCMVSAPVGMGLEINLAGTVANPGTHELNGTVRMSDALVAGGLTGKSYFLGGMLMRPELVKEQTELKIGLLFDLQIVKNNSAVRNRPGFSKNIDRLLAKLNSLTPTGRLVAEFNPAILSINLAKNIPLKNFDQIFIPARPGGIYVLGAVKKPGHYDFKNKSVVNIARTIKRQFADTDWVWLAQPDGTVEKIGVGLWNRQLEKVAAPGSIIFIPFIDKAFRGTQGFNRQMAEFLATQNINALNLAP